jgi:hypothetical protein
VLSRQKFSGQLAKLNSNADDLFDGYAALVRLVALSAIVSGDAHLLGIGEFRAIPIMTPAAALSRLGA